MKKFLICFIVTLLISCSTTSSKVSENSTECTQFKYAPVEELSYTTLSNGTRFQVVAYQGHDYIIVYRYGHGCSIIHSESCPCLEFDGDSSFYQFDDVD